MHLPTAPELNGMIWNVLSVSSDAHNAAQQSPTGGGPVPHQRLDHSWPTSCCLFAKCDGRSGSHPETEREGQTCSGHVRVSGSISISIISYNDKLIIIRIQSTQKVLTPLVLVAL